MPRTSEPGRSVSARLLDVLFAFRPGHSELSMSDLVEAPGIPRATVRRYVAELLTAGALDRTTAGTYTIGLRLWRLGTLAPSTEPLRRIAAPFIEDLYSALRQHVQLAVLEGDSAVVIERFSDRPRSAWSPGWVVDSPCIPPVPGKCCWPTRRRSCWIGSWGSLCAPTRWRPSPTRTSSAPN
uniref:helix-turn-helix domain-containing protein n=1 Tax=Granulicoccus phenolivorans TaxID=266854 RepID=UPI000AAD876A|nr:helix-turn-helix domain-containing protein [Granulicoccus phenolivorans]